MDIRELAKNFSYAIVAQGVSLVLSFVTSLLVPKVLGITEFGYWQLFIFYVGYVGLFNFGLNDGVYLINGGKSRQTICKRTVASQFWFSLLYQTFISLIISLWTLFFYRGEGERATIMFFSAFYLLLNNLSLYFGFLFQAMNETKNYSKSVLIDKLLYLAPLSLLITFKVTSFEPYVAFYTISRLISLIYCIYQGRVFLQVKPFSVKKAVTKSLESIRVGLKLTIANIAGTLITGVARFIIDGNWGIEEFGKVSFSLSLVNFFLVFVTQAGMVLFPVLRRGTNTEHKSFYLLARDATELLFPLVYVLYYPISLLVSEWLPQYSQSLHYFSLLLPMCVFESKMSITCTTMLKVLRGERLLLVINIGAVLFSLLTSLIGTYTLHSIDFVLFGAVLAIVSRSIVAEREINKLLKVYRSALSIQGLVLTGIFLTTTMMAAPYLAFIIVLTSYCCFIFLNRANAKAMLIKITKIFGKAGSNGVN